MVIAFMLGCLLAFLSGFFAISLLALLEEIRDRLDGIASQLRRGNDQYALANRDCDDDDGDDQVDAELPVAELVDEDPQIEPFVEAAAKEGRRLTGKDSRLVEKLGSFLRRGRPT